VFHDVTKSSPTRPLHQEQSHTHTLACTDGRSLIHTTIRSPARRIPRRTLRPWTHAPASSCSCVLKCVEFCWRQTAVCATNLASPRVDATLPVHWPYSPREGRAQSILRPTVDHGHGSSDHMALGWAHWCFTGWGSAACHDSCECACARGVVVSGLGRAECGVCPACAHGSL